MKKAFTGIIKDLEQIETGFAKKDMDTSGCVRAFVNDQLDILKKQAD